MVQTIRASIVSSSCLNDTIWRYVLEPEQFVFYQAGQYLQIHWPDTHSYYSIANAPIAAPQYELHVRHRSSSLCWDIQKPLTLSLPYGICHIGQLSLEKPILFIAIGTGFVPIRAMIDQLLYQSDPRPFALYWGVATAEDVYDPTRLQHWQTQTSRFQYTSHIGLTPQDALIAKILAQHPDIAHCQLVMAGPFELMYTLQKTFMQHGVAKHMIFSDAFEFEEK